MVAGLFGIKLAKLALGADKADLKALPPERRTWWRWTGRWSAPWGCSGCSRGPRGSLSTGCRPRAGRGFGSRWRTVRRHKAQTRYVSASRAIARAAPSAAISSPPRLFPARSASEFVAPSLALPSLSCSPRSREGS